MTTEMIWAWVSNAEEETNGSARQDQKREIYGKRAWNDWIKKEAEKKRHGMRRN